MRLRQIYIKSMLEYVMLGVFCFNRFATSINYWIKFLLSGIQIRKPKSMFVFNFSMILTIYLFLDSYFFHYLIFSLKDQENKLLSNINYLQNAVTLFKWRLIFEWETDIWGANLQLNALMGALLWLVVKILSQLIYCEFEFEFREHTDWWIFHEKKFFIIV
jgi:hypothetical protein